MNNGVSRTTDFTEEPIKPTHEEDRNTVHWFS